MSEKDYLTENQIILAHSPFKKFNHFKNNLIICTGILKIKEIMKSYGFNKFITVEEFFLIFPNHLPHFLRKFDQQKREEAILEVENRLNFKLEEDFRYKDTIVNNYGSKFQKVYKPFKIDKVFILTDVSNWESNIQILSDILISKSGIPGTISDKQEIELFVAANDLVYKGDFNINRLGLGSFNRSLTHIFKQQYNIDLKMNIVGKPNKLIFDFAKETLFKFTNTCENTDLYMVGDNPEVDIKGGKESGFKTCLVKTGVWNGSENHLKYPADYFVNCVQEGVNSILKENGYNI